MAEIIRQPKAWQHQAVGVVWNPCDQAQVRGIEALPALKVGIQRRSAHIVQILGISLAFPLRAPVLLHSKLHILSPISDKSSQEPVFETSEVNNKNNNSQKVSPDESKKQIAEGTEEPITDVQKMAKRRILPNKSILHVTDEILGSDSGISLHSREDGKPQNVFHKFALTKLNIPPENESEILGHCSGLPQDLRDLPFDMPKLRRRKMTLQQVSNLNKMI